MKNPFCQDDYSDVDISNMFVMGEEGAFADYLKSMFSSTADNEEAKSLLLRVSMLLLKWIWK